MNIKYLIIGIVSFVLGIIILMWFIKKPIKFHEDPKDNMGADDIVQHENLNKSWNQEAIIALTVEAVLNTIFQYSL